MKLVTISLLAISCFIFEVLAQSNLDSINILVAKDKALTLYELALEGTHHLYNGSEYLVYEPLDEEHPYFLTEEWTYCDLKYDGEWFRNVPLLFDIDKNKLIASYYYNGSKMQLVERRVDEFVLEGHRFTNLKNTADTTTVKKGYYELLYDGKTKVLARRMKDFIEKLEGMGALRKFNESSQVFVTYNGEYYKIQNKRDLLMIFSDRRRQVKDFIRDKQLFLPNNKENSIVQVAMYIDGAVQK